MSLTLPFVFWLVFCSICDTTSSTRLKSGACFLTRSPRGCREFIGYMNRKTCCQHNGYFVREPNQGQLFLAAFLNQHSIPNCENSCVEDYCARKICPVGQFCIMRDTDSICSSDCVCSPEQVSSGPVCISNGRRYKNMCELHLESCWTNVRNRIVPCERSSCDKLNCHQTNKNCLLTLQGRVKCVKKTLMCSSSIYRPICGVDNVTYSNLCHLKQAGINRNMEIQVAYKGICRADANCMNVECQDPDMSCINHHNNSSPVCIKCPTSMQQCDNNVYQTKELLCLSTKYETRNICYKDYLACQNNVFIEILNSGSCLLKAKWPR